MSFAWSCSLIQEKIVSQKSLLIKQTGHSESREATSHILVMGMKEYLEKLFIQGSIDNDAENPQPTTVLIQYFKVLFSSIHSRFKRI